MDDSMKGLLYIVGIIAALYLLIKYIMPIILKGLEILLSIALWIAIGAIVVYLVLYVVKMLNERY